MMREEIQHQRAATSLGWSKRDDFENSGHNFRQKDVVHTRPSSVLGLMRVGGGREEEFTPSTDEKV
jgi:hypothetical protein